MNSYGLSSIKKVKVSFNIHSSVIFYVTKHLNFQESEYCLGEIQFILPLGSYMVFVFWIKLVRNAVVTSHFYLFY